MRNKGADVQATPLRGATLRSLRPKRPLEESSDSMSDSPHGRRQRNRKNDKQVEVLKAKFDFNRLWTKKEIKALAEETGLSQSQVYKWRWDYRKKLQAEVLEEMSVRSFVTEEVLLPSQTDWELHELQRGYKKSTGKEEVVLSFAPSGLLALTK